MFRLRAPPTPLPRGQIVPPLARGARGDLIFGKKRGQIVPPLAKGARGDLIFGKEWYYSTTLRNTEIYPNGQVPSVRLRQVLCWN